MNYLIFSRSAQKPEPFRFLFHLLLLYIQRYSKPMNVI